MRTLLTLVVAAGLLVVGACKNELAGELTVDGKPFKLDSCRSGQVFGFPGVELRSDDGRRVRLVQTPTGEASVVVMDAGDPTGAELGKCGPFSQSTQNSTVNDVKNVKGHAQLDCSAEGHTVKGKVAFANCH